MKITRWRSKAMRHQGAWGVLAALVSACLFGLGTPLAKLLLNQTSPWLLAGLLYAGSGLGLLVYRQVRGLPTPRLAPNERGWLLAAVVCGGVLAPVLLMLGLVSMPASHAALLLNAEAVLTTLLAWAVFKEHIGRRIALGMAAIVAGALLLSWPSTSFGTEGLSAASLWPASAVLLACALWALDNNFTRKVSLNDATWIACVKGCAAGLSNLTLAFALGASLIPWSLVGASMTLGFFAYGVSLTLFVVALRHLGASRAGAYFSIAPFVGAVFSVLLLGEPVTWQALSAGALMALGVGLHLTEQHSHGHTHVALSHDHAHTHTEDDLHHQHAHLPGEWLANDEGGRPHSHPHQHAPQTHDHAHYPDAEHRHAH